jgi:hypothetical protein
MNPPEKIYLQYYGADKDDLTEEELNTDPVEVTWCTDKMFDTDVEYVRNSFRLVGTKALTLLEYIDHLEKGRNL